MNKRNLEATKTSLLTATERLMTKCAEPAQVTSRAIAREAGVNQAMINYCFGSREALLYASFEKMQTEAQRSNPAFEQILRENISPKQKLIELYCASVKMILKHLPYIRAVTKYALLTRSITSGKTFSFVKEYYAGERTDGECRLVAYEISSLHELAVLRHEELKEVCGIDLTNEIEMRKFVETHINMLLDGREVK